MLLTSEEVIINLAEDIEILMSYIEDAEENGHTFPEALKLDLESIRNDLDTAYNKEYSNEELI